MPDLRILGLEFENIVIFESNIFKLVLLQSLVEK